MHPKSKASVDGTPRLHAALRRTSIPRGEAASGALRGAGSAIRSGAPGWLAAATIAGLAMHFEPSVAHADAGSVRLRNGGRVRGEVVAVVPNDRVIVLFPDGTSLTVPWADVLFVFDGSRVYDSLGNVEMLDPPAPPPPTSTAPAPVPAPVAVAPQVPAQATLGFGTTTLGYRPATSDRAAYDQLRRLPRRGTAVAEVAFGSLFLLGGFATTVAGAVIEAHDDGYDCSGCGPSAAVALVLPGVVSLGIGAVMAGIGGHQLRKRRAGLDDLRGRGFFVVGMHDSLQLGFDADVRAGQFVPRLTLRF